MAMAEESYSDGYELDGNEQNKALETPEKPENQQNSNNSIRKKKNKKVTDKVPYYKLFSFADSTDYVLMTLGTITAIGSGFSVPIMALLFGELVNSFGENLDATEVVNNVSQVSLKFVYLALGSGIATFSQVACWMATGDRQAARIRLLYLRAILRQDVEYFDKETSSGEIIQRMSGDTLIIQDAMGEKVGRFLQLLTTFLGGFTIALIKGWLLSLVLLSSVPLMVISAATMTVLMTKLTSRRQIAYSAAATVVEQTITSIRTVASFTGERLAITKYNKSLDDAYRSGVQEGLAAGLGSGVFMFFFLCSYALAVWFGAKMILEKAYTGGDVMNVIIAILTGSFSLGQASPCLSAFAAGQVATFKMFQTIDRTPNIDTYNTKGQKLDKIIGDIELRDVYFSYPARPEEQVLNGFSFSIPKGTTAALVGKSGCGKSTVMSLIERFYDPQAGVVLIDGIDIKEFDLRWIRGNIGIVSQEPVLFASSIKENIAYGRDGATLEEIEAAAKHANAASFIERLPQGLDTMVGVHGAQLSGGQKQRIAIARAILKDPRILLLDEATSALDAESERTVQEALDKVMVGRTTFIVAHRLSAIKNANIIAVIHEGKIAEKGSHSELLQDSKGAYSQLVQLEERSKVSELIVTNQDVSEITTNSERHSDLQISLLQSTSQGSIKIGDSSDGSCSNSTGITPVDDMVEAAMIEPHAPAPAPLQMDKQVPLCRLAYLNKPEILDLLLGSLAAAVNGLILPLIGVFHSRIIKSFYEPAHKLKKDSEFWASMYLVLGGACLLATPLRTYFFAVAGCKLIKRIRLMCFDKVVHMDIRWFDKIENSSGAIGARLSIDATCVRTLVGESLSLLVQNIATAIAGLVIGFLASWRLALIVLVMLPLIGLNGYLQMKFISGISGDTKKLYEEASQVASDAVGSIRTVSAYCAEEKVVRLYQNKCEGPVRARIKQGLIGGAGFGLSMFFLYLVYATSFYVGAQFVEARKITFAEVFQVFYGLSMMAVGISQSGALAPDSSKAMSGAASIFALLDQKSEIDSSDDDSGIILDQVKGDIEFQHVSFKYPSRPDVQILKDLCLAIHSGKTVALVGESGSGKSTVISLLQRFYDPDSGCITLDGIQLQKLKLKWLRQQMGLVSQEPVLFNETIRANIAYGKEGNATEAEILAAAKLANAHKFISGLHKGYDTIVGERGIQLSGGQKQRVAIARAVVKDPKIILLDEATSALDAESEKVVQDALDRVMLDKTTLVVAHRLSTIKGADLIAIMKDGIIAERGNHETLINSKNGIYSSLVALYAGSSSQEAR